MPTAFKHFVAPYFTQCVLFTGVFLLTLLPQIVSAATLAITPQTGVYTTGQTFSVNVLVNTAGVPVNAADGTITYNPKELSVVAVSRTTSIFNLWTAEPSFSNGAGSVTFSGGVPTGYTGQSGTVMTITFKSLTSGAARVQISGGSVLAADGKGTNVLTNMSGGTYTLAAASTQPEPEVIVEYVAPANTPGSPAVTSPTHPDQSKWYTATEAVLNWAVPADIVAVRTLLDTKAVSVPSKVYDTPINTITLSDMSSGVSYFHIQFKNADGWGKVTHYKLAVDNQKPESFTLALLDGADLANPNQMLKVAAVDKTSAVLRFKVQLDGKEPFEFTATSSSSSIPLPALLPGYHTVVAEGFDAAGNSLISSFSFTILAFDKPVFTDYPAVLSSGVIPVIKGVTRPRSSLVVSVVRAGTETEHIKVMSAEDGTFTYIPDEAFAAGVYELSAVAIDEFGAQSESSDSIRILVQKPGYIAIGSFLINILSVIIPLLALCVLGWILIVYGLHRIRLLRARVLRESKEATATAVQEFAAIRTVLESHEVLLTSSRKTGKLTLQEAALMSDIRRVIDSAEVNVEKEVADVTKLVEKNNS